MARGEVDFILCYDVPDLPQLSRVALLQDDLVLVTPPRARKGQPIALVDALEDSIAMPEEGDTVRTVVTRTARDLGLELKIAYEVRSISAMKSLVSRGAASSILPYFAVLDEVRAGKLDARPITMPAHQANAVSRLVEAARSVQERGRADRRRPVVADRLARCAWSPCPAALGSHRLAPAARRISARSPQPIILDVGAALSYAASHRAFMLIAALDSATERLLNQGDIE